MTRTSTAAVSARKTFALKVSAAPFAIRAERASDVVAREALLDVCFGANRYGRTCQRIRDGRVLHLQHLRPPLPELLKVGVRKLARRMVPRMQRHGLASKVGRFAVAAHLGVDPLAVMLSDCEPLAGCVAALTDYAGRA